ncbi:PH domain-containing protein [Pseudoxanthomonas putridarboris]|uniref:PH domain-containing protein n=1 Tax=Pseudoxanthomonas putridarboris TaxID=752605 RepID=A0ABU9IX52_9GAMM
MIPPTDPAPPSPDAGDTVHTAPIDWRPLPPRGALLAALGGAMAMLPLGFPLFFIIRATGLASPWLATPLVAAAGAVVGAWIGVRRHRRTSWKLDGEGFAVRRGNWWRNETLIPISRVQHLDLKRGPLERGMKLATLVVHTAGTRMAALSLSGLDTVDAERLRDTLARQLDHDDAL